jgi:hypothetical protein
VRPCPLAASWRATAGSMRALLRARPHHGSQERRTSPLASMPQNHTARAPDSLAKHNVSFDGTAPRAKSASGSSSQSYSITSIGSAVPLAASDAPIANFPICGCGYDVQLASPQV